MQAVSRAIGAGKLGEAKALAIELLNRGAEHPALLSLRALDHEDAGRFEAALTDLRRAHLIAPGDFTVLNATGLCLVRLGRFEDALRCYEQALALQPAFGQAWFNLGWALDRLGRTVEAEKAYEQALTITPQNAQAWANLASLAARRGDVETTRVKAASALALEPAHPTAELALASVEADDPTRAEHRLRDMLRRKLSDYDRAVALGQLGDALDRLQRPAQAFDAYTASNALIRADARKHFERPGQETVADTVDWLNEWADGLSGADWALDLDAESEAGERSHVFLLGFPRSGTTLLENVLARHPDVATLEERDTLRAAVSAFLDRPDSVRRLASATGRELDLLRSDYWARVRRFGVTPEDRIVVDKHPFNTLKLPLIMKLFPRARILFAVRDPRDVTLSCFRRRFDINPSTYEFLDLEGAARVYDGTMRFAETLRGMLSYRELLLIHEALVTDFEATARAACEFIGADWDVNLTEFAGRARRGEVASASSAQIAKGLNAEGLGQWRRFRAQLKPVLPRLAPWVARFGYAAD